jgi:UDP-N-acetylglucosamine 2-epimerase (non-hydrolysing)
LSELAACLQLVEPLRYLDFLRLQADATVVFTDSGGIQEETTVLGVPCLTLRENTERPITITEGTNQLVGLDPDRIRSAFFGLDPSQRGRRPELWDGQTAARTADILMRGTPDVVWQPRAFAFPG